MTINYLEIFITLLGASKVQLGAVKSVSGFAEALISPPLGIIRDRYNIRKIYLFGIALYSVIPLFFIFANSWQWVAPAIFINGLAMMIGSCVIICDLSLPHEDRATMKSLCEGVGALPTILAPTVAAGILILFGGITVDNIKKLYWIQFAANLVLFIYVFRNLTDIERPEPSHKKLNIIGDFKEVMDRGTATRRWLLFQGLNTFSMTMQASFRYPYIYEVKEATPFIIGAVGTAMLITEAFFSTIIGRMADTVGRKKAFYILVPLFSIANLALIFSPSPRWLLLSGLLMGFRTLSYFSFGSMTPELVPPDCFGRWRGLIGLATGLAAIPAPIVGGWIWETYGPEWVFIAVILIDVLLRVPLLSTIPETLRKRS